MALVNRRSAPGYDAVSAANAPQTPGNLYAGQDIDAGASCYIAADGTVMMSNGTAANIAAHCDGFAVRDAKQGEPITLYGPGIILRYADAVLTPGATYYVAATAGRLDDAATTGDNLGVARAIDASHIRIIRFK